MRQDFKLGFRALRSRECRGIRGPQLRSGARIIGVSEGFTVSGILDATGLNHRLDVAAILAVRLPWSCRGSRAEILIAG
jgi:hypothetical protein